MSEIGIDWSPIVTPVVIGVINITSLVIGGLWGCLGYLLFKRYYRFGIQAVIRYINELGNAELIRLTLSVSLIILPMIWVLGSLLLRRHPVDILAEITASPTIILVLLLFVNVVCKPNDFETIIKQRDWRYR